MGLSIHGIVVCLIVLFLAFTMASILKDNSVEGSNNAFTSSESNFPSPLGDNTLGSGVTGMGKLLGTHLFLITCFIIIAAMAYRAIFLKEKHP